MIAEALRGAGAEVDIVDASSRDQVKAANFDVDGVVVAGGVYAGFWHKSARLFVNKKRRELRKLPVWLVQSGPLDDSAARGDLSVARQVAKAAELISARGTQVFGGALAEDTNGTVAKKLVQQGRAGDWRDPEHVQRWAAGVYKAVAPHTSPYAKKPRKPPHR